MLYSKEVETIVVTDPDTDLPVHITIMKLSNGAMIGIDESFIANTDEPLFSPFDSKRVRIRMEGEDF